MSKTLTRTGIKEIQNVYIYEITQNNSSTLALPSKKPPIISIIANILPEVNSMIPRAIISSTLHIGHTKA